ncbi:MAG TPA: RsmG family class I SAM-dependent methyltransferase [Candidatus Polarisedimenticolaceae bacterium]|nr:RsmG family class I SAM-dependent methyltransferase [Candidatus Polarisedimenticolaceae bacterium]
MISEEAVAARARRAGLTLPSDTIAALTAHGRAVLEANARLHLTTVVDPEAFVERHVGESLDGAALLPPEAAGVLVDVGSGNGYPGVPLGLARPGLRVVLAEASTKKAAFLEGVTRALPAGRFRVLHAQVQRAEDLADTAPEVLASRAMGNWERVLPRLARALPSGGRVLLWAGAEAEGILEREAWSGLRLLRRQPIAGRERSWIWMLERTPTVVSA